MLIVGGRWNYADGVGNLIAYRLCDMSEWLERPKPVFMHHVLMEKVE